MTTIREKNVSAAQWTANGSGLGTLDLTKDQNNPFGINVFSPAVQKERLSGSTFSQLQSTLEDLEVAMAAAGTPTGPDDTELQPAAALRFPATSSRQAAGRRSRAA